MSKYADLKTEIKELREDLKTETLKNKKLNEALKNCLDNLEDVSNVIYLKDKALENSQQHYIQTAKRCSELTEVKDMLIEENNKLRSFNESKTENISNLITDSIAKDKEISSLRFMINEMKGW